MFPGQTEAQTDRQDEGFGRSSSDGAGKEHFLPTRVVYVTEGWLEIDKHYSLELYFLYT